MSLTGDAERGHKGGPTRVVRNAEEHRYELLLGDQRIGTAAYEAEPGRLVVTHTEVTKDLRSKGFGERLARGLLEDIRAEGLEVEPRCPFLAEYVDDHPEYADLVRPMSRSRS